jgi:hypothetical protein
MQEGMNMAKPRVFIGSTYYDLKYIRDGIETFIKGMGYVPILFEKGDIPFDPDRALEDSCYQEVESADMLILIVGGRYGAISGEDQEKIKKNPTEYFGRIRSITNREYEQARERNLATFIFIEQSVFAEYRTYKENKGNKSIRFAHVDDAHIYEMVDDILKQKKGNFIKDFAVLEDITSWLRDQWAGLFVELLRKRNASVQIKKIESQIGDLKDVVGTLKKYSEELIKEINKKDSSRIIDTENRRTLAAKANRLKDEPMVKYLYERNDVKLSPEELLDKLISSVDARSFLKYLFPDDTATDLFINDYDPTVTMDYMELKKRYSPGGA